MPQITIYLDKDTEMQARSAARARKVPLSKWISSLIRERSATTWPREILDLAGAWPDFPAVEDLRKHQRSDSARERL